MIEDLYKEYGQATIEVKIWSARVQQLEAQIAEALGGLKKSLEKPVEGSVIQEEGEIK